jgi:hypothetical protein
MSAIPLADAVAALRAMRPTPGNRAADWLAMTDHQRARAVLAVTPQRIARAGDAVASAAASGDDAERRRARLCLADMLHDLAHQTGIAVRVLAEHKPSAPPTV